MIHLRSTWLRTRECSGQVKSSKKPMGNLSVSIRAQKSCSRTCYMNSSNFHNILIMVITMKPYSHTNLFPDLVQVPQLHSLGSTISDHKKLRSILKSNQSQKSALQTKYYSYSRDYRRDYDDYDRYRSYNDHPRESRLPMG